MDFINKIIEGDCLTDLREIPDNSIDCSVSSPPYWGLRDYRHDGQIGNEDNFNDFIGKLIAVYKEVFRVLKPTGTCFVNLGDTFTGSAIHKSTHKNPGISNSGLREGFSGNVKPSYRNDGFSNKNLMMIPERFAIAMMDNGWILRNQIIWHKPNQMPQSATDRFTVDFEKIFFFVKQPTEYYFQQQLEKSIWAEKDTRFRKDRVLKTGKCEKGEYAMNVFAYRNDGMRNMRTVWSVNTSAFSDSHFATFPEKLAKRMIISGCPENGVVLDPFMGSGTTAVVARKLNRNFTGFEINEDYITIANKRIEKEIGLFL